LVSFFPIPITGFAHYGAPPAAFHFNLSQIDYQFTPSIKCDSIEITLDKDRDGPFFTPINRENLSCLEAWFPNLVKKEGYQLKNSQLITPQGIKKQTFLIDDPLYNLGEISFLEDYPFVLGELKHYYWSSFQGIRGLASLG
jgi:hypothetical protein